MVTTTQSPLKRRVNTLANLFLGLRFGGAIWALKMGPSLSGPIFVPVGAGGSKLGLWEYRAKLAILENDEHRVSGVKVSRG